MPDPEQFPVEAQATNAHVLKAVAEFKTEVNGRFDTLEGKVDELEQTVTKAGLNGHTPLLKKFLEEYSETATARQAWRTVQGDLKHRLRFLAPGKHWLTVLLGAIIGGIGWQIASGHLPLPH